MPQQSDEQAVAEKAAQILDEPADVMTLLQQEEDKIIAASESGESESEETPSSAESETEAPSVAEAGPTMDSLSSKIEALTGVVHSLIGGQQPKAEQEEEAEYEIEYDVGDLPEEFEPLRPILNRMGQAIHKELASQHDTVSKMASAVDAGFNEINADRVRERFKITPALEDKITEYARERGLRYQNARQLGLVVEDYFKIHPEDNPRREQKPAAGKKPSAADKSMEATRPSGGKTFDTLAVRKPGRRSFNDSWETAIQKVSERVRTGRPLSI